jgi:hypothetical protein
VRLLEALTESLELAAQASLEKRVFLEKLLARGEAGALALLTLRQGKSSLCRSVGRRMRFVQIGLAELTHAVTGYAWALAPEAFNFASQIATHLHNEAERLSAKHKVQFPAGRVTRPQRGASFRAARSAPIRRRNSQSPMIEASNEDAAFYTTPSNCRSIIASLCWNG